MFDRIKQNFGSDEEMKKQIASHGQTVDTVKEEIRASLRQEHWIDSQIKDKTEVTETEADEFYKNNPDKFKQPERGARQPHPRKSRAGCEAYGHRGKSRSRRRPSPIASRRGKTSAKLAGGVVRGPERQG